MRELVFVGSLPQMIARSQQLHLGLPRGCLQGAENLVPTWNVRVSECHLTRWATALADPCAF